MVWIPDRSVLFTGDLLFVGGTPFVPMGSVSGSLAALERVRAYRLVLQPGQSTGVVRLSPRTVRVAGSAANIIERGADGGARELHLTPAQFEWRTETMNR